jgi:hypothetical protein
LLDAALAIVAAVLNRVRAAKFAKSRRQRHPSESRATMLQMRPRHDPLKLPRCGGGGCRDNPYASNSDG